MNPILLDFITHGVVSLIGFGFGIKVGRDIIINKLLSIINEKQDEDNE